MQNTLRNETQNKKLLVADSLWLHLRGGIKWIRFKWISLGRAILLLQFFSGILFQFDFTLLANALGLYRFVCSGDFLPNLHNLILLGAK